MHKLLAATISALLAVASTYAVIPDPPRIRPKEVGQREIIAEFTIQADGTATDIRVVASEAPPLDRFVTHLIAQGQVGRNSAGVVEIGVNRFRAIAHFPIANDKEALPEGTVPPQPRLRPTPPYPYKLVQSGTTGGALLAVSIDRKGRITAVDPIRASHPEFEKAAIDAVKKWKFARPATRDGKPIDITLFQLMTFEIANGPVAPMVWQVSPEPALSEYTVTAQWITK